MSKTEQSIDRVPSMMQIINAVGRVAEVSSAMIMGGERAQHLIRARSAIFKIADAHGYSLREIMDYINHNRTVGYNYKSNLGGHLKRDEQFKSICEAAEQYLSRVSPRAHREPRITTPSLPDSGDAIKVSEEDEAEIGEPTDTAEAREPDCEPPVFEAWKGKLGWSFSADDMERVYYAMREAKRWFGCVYCKRFPSTSTNRE